MRKKETTPTIKQLRDEAKKLNIVGRFQMDKDQLIEAIAVAKTEKGSKVKAEKTDPISIAAKLVADAKTDLKEARENLLKQETADGVQKAKLEIKAAENRLRIKKAQLKEVKKAAKEANGKFFSWSTLGWTALLLSLAAGVGIGTAALTEKYATPSESGTGNGDNL